MAVGYACEYKGEIHVRTVQDTERGAMVNGLLVFGGFFAQRGMTDEYLWGLFKEHLEPKGVKVINVSILPLKKKVRETKRVNR